ncbi:hypothetical protein ACROYT_G008550 [Oculina patagonica]
MLSNAFFVAFVFGTLLVVDAYPERKHGECWAAKDFSFNIDGIGKGCTSTNHESCTYESSVCVGEDFYLFVYNVQQ